MSYQALTLGVDFYNSRKYITYPILIIVKELRSMATDPVCKMTVDEKTAKLKTEHNRKTYYFCAPGCKAAFEKTPEKYLGK